MPQTQFKKLKTLCFSCFLCWVFLTLPPHAHATNDKSQNRQKTSSNTPKPEKPISGSLSYYFDSREFNTLNIVTSIKGFPLGFNIFGFIDLHGDENKPSERFDITRYFIEYRLRRTLDPDWVFGIEGIGVEAEYNDLNGPDNSLVRFGVNYKHKFKLFNGRTHWLQWRFLPGGTERAGKQLSLVNFISISPRFFISGFSDYNIFNNSRNKWVSEQQLNFILNKTIDIVLEGRYNGFEDENPKLDGYGIAGGIKIKF